MPSCFKPAGFDAIKDVLRFHVNPRYTPGSPGIVRDSIAQQIIRRESDAYNYMINGLDGEAKKEQARTLGLSGIVEERWKYEGRLYFRDMITRETGVIKDDGTREVFGRL
jgi:hypothetical protein